MVSRRSERGYPAGNSFCAARNWPANGFNGPDLAGEQGSQDEGEESCLRHVDEAFDEANKVIPPEILFARPGIGPRTVYNGPDLAGEQGSQDEGEESCLRHVDEAFDAANTVIPALGRRL